VISESVVLQPDSLSYFKKKPHLSISPSETQMMLFHLMPITIYVHFYMIIIVNSSISTFIIVTARDPSHRSRLHCAGYCENTELKENNPLLLTIFVNITQDVDGEIELRGINKRKMCLFVTATGLSTLPALPSLLGKEL